jgi:RimJ/RimL family protein N-acetyltransferase
MSDLDEYFLFLQDEEMIKFTGAKQEFTREQISNWIQKISVKTEDRVDFMIICNETGELIGEVVLNEMDLINRSTNIRIGIRGTNHRGKGIGTEAMVQMLPYGFETLNLHRIHLGVYTFNKRAVHMYEKIGFQSEGIERDLIYLEGSYHDMIRMSMLEEEFRSIYKK